jgi:serine/threonine-protein kinase HipA
MRKLWVYYQDRVTGQLEETDEGYRFTYDSTWVDEGRNPVSLTLPLRREPWESRTLFAFFDGLIPEGWLLELGVRNWKLDPRDRFGLLAAFCRDTIGAVGVGPVEGGMMQMNKCLVCFAPLDSDYPLAYHKRCAKALFESTTAPAMDLDMNTLTAAGLSLLRSSGTVPGVQKKLSVDRHPENGRRLTLRALGGRYILKAPVAEYPHLPENEAFCMELSARLGYPTAPHGLVHLADGTLAYLSRRFDRPADGSKLPQEDFCQLCQRPAADKYKGSLEAAAKVLAHSRQAGLDAVRFLQLNLLSWLMGNADLHLKNFSLYQPTPGLWHLTPAYDLVSTALVIPADKEETALTLNGKKSRLSKGDWQVLAGKLGVAPKVFDNIKNHLQEAWPQVEALCQASFLPVDQQDAFLARWQERAEKLRGGTG